MTARVLLRRAGALVLAAFPVVCLAQAPAPAARPAPAAQAPLPPIEQVLNRYRTAIGGAAAIKRHTSRTMIGALEISGQGMKGDVRILAAAPDKFRLAIKLAGLGDLERGYDGHVGWSVDPTVGPRLLQGRELDELKQSADFFDELHDPSRYKSITVVSRGPFEGHDCYEVQVVRMTGFEYTEYFDATSGLLTGVKMDATTQMGTVPVTTVMSDYKPFGGILTPTTTHQRMMGLESVMTISNVTFDDVPPGSFDLPPAIAALMKQQ